MWQRWQGFDDSFILGCLQGPHCVLNILKIIRKCDFIHASQSQNPKERLWAILTCPGDYDRLQNLIPLMTNSGGVAISNPDPPNLEAPDHHTSRLHQQNAVTTDVIMSTAYCADSKACLTQESEIDLLWAIPLVSAGRDSKLRFEGHTRRTCSLMLQLDVCFLGIC